VGLLSLELFVAFFMAIFLATSCFSVISADTKKPGADKYSKSNMP
jgi:hypothetical protein